MSEPIDYEKLLDGLLVERADLDRVIQWTQRRIASGAAVETAMPPTAPTVTTARLPIATDTFTGLKVIDAIQACLKIANRKPQSASAITSALAQGGLKYKAKNLYQTVFPALRKLERDGKVVRVPKTNEWGLAEWYGKNRVEELEK